MVECKNCIHKNVCKYTDVTISFDTTVKDLIHECKDYIAEAKLGEWVKDNTISTNLYYNCSLCGNFAGKDNHGNFTILTPYYCLCGATMRRKNNE